MNKTLTVKILHSFFCINSSFAYRFSTGNFHRQMFSSLSNIKVFLRLWKLTKLRHLQGLADGFIHVDGNMYKVSKLETK